MVAGGRTPVQNAAVADLDPDSPARDVLHRRLTQLAERLPAAVAAAREDRDDGLHRTRTTCRRLRAVLVAYRPLVDRERVEPVRDELRWLARALGERRDVEVVGERLGRLLDEEEPRLVRGPVRRRLATHQRAARRTTGAAEYVLGSDRCARLVEAVRRLAESPPWTVRADKRASKVVTTRLRKELSRVADRLDAVPDGAPGARAERERDEAVHDLRKAVKRLRYAAEVARPAFGADADRLTKRAKRLTTALGDRQDTVETRALLRTLADEAEQSGEPTFTWGRLHAREESAAHAVEADLPRLWDAVARDKTSGWVR